MPIHTSWAPMIRGMGRTYPGPKKCRKLSNGKQICVSDKAWSVFYGKLNKMGAKDTSPMPKSTEESLEEIVDWYVKRLKKNE